MVGIRQFMYGKSGKIPASDLIVSLLKRFACSVDLSPASARLFFFRDIDEFSRDVFLYLREQAGRQHIFAVLVSDRESPPRLIKVGFSPRVY